MDIHMHTWTKLTEIKLDVLEVACSLDSDDVYTREMAVIDLLALAKKAHELEGDILHAMNKVGTE